MKKKIVIFGTSGMLGHQLIELLKNKNNLKIITIYHKNTIHNKNLKSFKIKDFTSIKLFFLLKKIKPSIIINCVGMINHRINKKNLEKVFFINSIFPHLLATYCKNYFCRLIHISTDCVFNGKKGNYSEKDKLTGTDNYSITKILGEPLNKYTTVIRTSIIGHEKFRKLGLLEWFLSSKKNIIGFKRVFFSGLTTLELSKIIYKYFIKKKIFSGKIVHISGKRISKFDLLNKIKKIYSHNVEIFPSSRLKIDKTLNSSYFLQKTNYAIPSWDKLIYEMKLFYERNFKK